MPEGHPTTVLLVEDEMLVRMMVVDHLEELGFRVVEAGSAAEARERLAADDGATAAAVVDVGLPDGKGDALAAEIRDQRPGLAIVIASGYGEHDLRERFRGDSRIAILGKPYDPDQLVAALAALGVEATTPP